MYNQSPAVVIILDNSTTAMTGHQDNPGTGKTLLRKETTAVDLEALVKALGVRNVWKVDPYDLKATERAIKEALAVKEPAVVIAEHPCLLIERKGPNHLAIDEERCNGCGLCQRPGCPAIEKEGGIVHINEVPAQDADYANRYVREGGDIPMTDFVLVGVGGRDHSASDVLAEADPPLGTTLKGRCPRYVSKEAA